MSRISHSVACFIVAVLNTAAVSHARPAEIVVESQTINGMAGAQADTTVVVAPLVAQGLISLDTGTQIANAGTGLPPGAAIVEGRATSLVTSGSLALAVGGLVNGASGCMPMFPGGPVLCSNVSGGISALYTCAFHVTLPTRGRFSVALSGAALAEILPDPDGAYTLSPGVTYTLQGSGSTGSASWSNGSSGTQTFPMTAHVRFDLLPQTPVVPGDATGDGQVNIDDLLTVIGTWGACPNPANCPADVNHDGLVNIDDLLVIINNWG